MALSSMSRITTSVCRLSASSPVNIALKQHAGKSREFNTTTTTTLHFQALYLLKDADVDSRGHCVADACTDLYILNLRVYNRDVKISGNSVQKFEECNGTQFSTVLVVPT